MVDVVLIAEHQQYSGPLFWYVLIVELFRAVKQICSVWIRWLGVLCTLHSAGWRELGIARRRERIDLVVLELDMRGRAFCLVQPSRSVSIHYEQDYFCFLYLVSSGHLV